ncbi:hypothetical protein OE749_16705 [Aestuariibacter sp. AA17]|uniref:Uncharacterized protein n=1 Tax=Fluctibacter corallii TaxID=2984329 RepID=A0ABT3ACN0_9ALTE|nr:hypothetical protein [Aestuariibacter sp. AA17]MCV2886337.1 hypothetical protein [Aestuariibacter sp. AA17]
MRKIVFSSCSGDVASSDVVVIHDEMWERYYSCIEGYRDIPIFQRLWKHQFGKEAEPQSVKANFEQLADEFDTILQLDGTPVELRQFIIDCKASVDRAIKNNATCDIIAE